MDLQTLKQHLAGLEKVTFQLPNGQMVPKHFHVTEVGKVSKHFIDCGGTERLEEVISIQLWSSIDVHHRLKAEKFLGILELSEQKLAISNLPIEVEYQGDTIGKYGLDFNGENFVLTSKQTDCLAKEGCGVPNPVNKVLETVSSCCTPSSGCC